MMQNEEIDPGKKNPGRLRFDWLLPVVIHPRAIMKEIAGREKGVWLAPLLLLSLMMVILALASGPASKAAIEKASAEMPQDFEYYTPEQQEQFLKARDGAANPTFIYIIPAVSRIASVWVSWFLLGGILYLVLTLMGSRTTSVAAFNLAAWSSIPIALRSLVQAVAILATNRLISAPGLSGFAPLGVTGIASLFWVMMRSFDLFLIWQVILLGLGVIPLSKMTGKKAWGSVMLAVVIFILVISLPNFIGLQIASAMKGGM